MTRSKEEGLDARRVAKLARKDARLRAIAARFDDERLAQLFDGKRCVLVDGGAKGGVQKEWLPALRYLEVVGAEPQLGLRDDIDVDVGDELKPEFVGPGARKRKQYPTATSMIPYALGEEVGVRDFYVTAGPSMCSFLRPNLELSRLYGLGESAEIRRVVQVPTTTLDALVEEHGLRFVDFVKLDTQGSELEILRGGSRVVRELVYGLRVETCFAPLYENQPLFAEVDEYVRSLGFELVDLIHVKRYPRVSGRDGRPAPPGGQIVVADPLYLRPATAVAARLESLSSEDRQRYVAGAILVCLVYGKIDYAFELLAHTRALLDDWAYAAATGLLDADAASG